ncbi:MAG TPA: phosphoenolpyruvate carboxykinase [Candidatus Omnitrophota bacterium]|jgi:energy-coupling factor transporter ATP-binding protein EcfA2|nr:phosphoenolpyruvate carboxykinase [Candidatus Omnitrophota bacterium]
MKREEFEILDRKVIIRIKDRLCETGEELLTSSLFKHILKICVQELKEHNSYLLKIFPNPKIQADDLGGILKTFLFLTKMPSDLVPKVVPEAAGFLKHKALLNEFVDYLYNYWRSYDRFVICSSKELGFETRPYRIFNNTVEHLTHLVRATYRDIQENITGSHPNIYRQVRAGAEISTIAVPNKIQFTSKDYAHINAIPVIQQVLLYPPLILNPPMNKRTGSFERVEKNPIKSIEIDKEDWLCYPAKVGDLLIFVYFHKKFAELGFSLCNLFELAQDEDLKRKPDAIYFFGVKRSSIEGLGKSLTIFYEDKKEDLLVAAAPNDDEFGYFGYLKKMVLTLHNIIMMKRGILPFHGALVQIMLPKNKKATVLLIGDTGAGKSETLEALRELGKADVQDIIIIADDMGSIQFDKKGDAIGYGTEIGAFLRLDDLQPGYAFGQMDRAIIMSPNKVNARIVLPVTTFERVITGFKIDYILYANNYEEIDTEHPLIEQMKDGELALRIFREGTVMSKGTTTSTGLVHSYFANIFGPPQYKDLHEKLAQKYFKKFFESKIFVGQMRTRLGIPGHERTGPSEAAKALLEILNKRVQ